MRHGSFQGRPQNRNNNRHRGGSQNGGGQPRQHSNNGGGRPHRNQVLDSNGPDVRVRGTAFQINEKYMTLAKDASSMGDLILAENYFQHAEHYQRMINEFEPQQTHQPQSYDNAPASEGVDEQPTERSEEGTVTSTRPVATISTDDGDDDGIRVVRRAPRRRVSSPVSDDADLGLPTSILGGDIASS